MSKKLGSLESKLKRVGIDIFLIFWHLRHFRAINLWKKQGPFHPWSFWWGLIKHMNHFYSQLNIVNFEHVILPVAISYFPHCQLLGFIKFLLSGSTISFLHQYTASSQLYCPTLIKKRIKFSSYIKKIQNGAVAQSYMTNGLLIYMGKYLRIPSYIRKPFDFLFYQCRFPLLSVMKKSRMRSELNKGQSSKHYTY